MEWVEGAKISCDYDTIIETMDEKNFILPNDVSIEGRHTYIY
ncbi:hypothetical protein [Virgibacillus salinus]|uniref:Uncharacterized protein n=1 Tax=Virgibacillus salinus TaxID=553311 RepID=A0A1H0YAQ8_9BACI|nr:hypothetical protein [Virgibacillus salinus]SDQ12207.1 hypothetical protein SAMN05216231_0537 [Virgibacillus salinus]